MFCFLASSLQRSSSARPAYSTSTTYSTSSMPYRTSDANNIASSSRLPAPKPRTRTKSDENLNRIVRSSSIDKMGSTNSGGYDSRTSGYDSRTSGYDSRTSGYDSRTSARPIWMKMSRSTTDASMRKPTAQVKGHVRTTGMTMGEPVKKPQLRDNPIVQYCKSKSTIQPIPGERIPLTHRKPPLSTTRFGWGK